MNANANDSLIAAIGGRGDAGARLASGPGRDGGAGGGGQVRLRGAGAAVRDRHRRAPVALRDRLRGRLRRGQRAVWSCPSFPTAACESSTTAPSATRPRAARRSASGAWRPRSTSCGRSSGRPRSPSPSRWRCGRARKTPAQVAALAAAVLIAVQLGATHWFYFYVVWFLPLVLAALFVAQRGERAQPIRRLQPPQGRRADRDLVAGLQPDPGLAGAADAGRRAGRDDVAGLERHQAGQVGDERRHREDQVVGGRRLHLLPVQGQREGDRRRRGPPRRASPAPGRRVPSRRTPCPASTAGSRTGGRGPRGR